MNSHTGHFNVGVGNTGDFNIGLGNYGNSNFGIGNIGESNFGWGNEGSYLAGYKVVGNSGFGFGPITYTSEAVVNPAAPVIDAFMDWGQGILTTVPVVPPPN